MALIGKRATQTGYTRIIELVVITGVVTSFVIPIYDGTNE
jgi:hypothetical protein